MQTVVLGLSEVPSEDGKNIQVDFKVQYLNADGDEIDFDASILSHRIINTMLKLFDDYNAFLEEQKNEGVF